MSVPAKPIDVVCLGILVADTLAKPIRGMPEWGTLQLIEQVELHTGGCANNTATALARLGFKAAVIGKVGQDGFGDFVLQRLRSEGVDVRGIRRDDQVNTSFTFVMIHPEGERAFFHYMGANAALTLDDVDFSIIESARILDIGGTQVMPGIDGEPTAEILRRARAAGLITCLDTVYNAEVDGYALLKPCFEHLDYFLPSLGEAQLIAGRESPADVARFFLDQGVKTVSIKLGTEGCYIATQTQAFHVPAFRVETVDNTGAGDAWVAGFLVGLLQGWDLEKTARFANAVGATCVQAIGCTAGIRSLDETLAFMASTPTRA